MKREVLTTIETSVCGRYCYDENTGSATSCKFCDDSESEYSTCKLHGQILVIGARNMEERCQQCLDTEKKAKGE